MRITRFLWMVWLMVAPPALANEQSFDAWRSALQAEAQARGFDASLVQALGELKMLPKVITLDRKQPESTLTMEEYLQKVLPESRIEKARALYAEHRAVLQNTAALYGVQPQYIVALWGIESNFGERMGDFEIIEALATLAYDGRRSAYFRKELFNALTIVQEGHVALHDMRGSWAGAMGQCQFMPTSFLNYAVDANGDGRKDIWNTEADVFASIANYLSSEGWDSTKGWGTREAPADNFNVLMRWNRSRYFGTAVGQLADAIAQE